MQVEQPDPVPAIAARLKEEREARRWSLAELAARSRVSKAMISKIERCETSPTATVLGRLSGAFGLPLSALLILAEQSSDRLSLHQEQPLWHDPQTGYTRRAVSPSGAAAEVIQVELPPGVRVPYPASAFAFQQQQIWVLSGLLEFQEGEILHRLGQGDCLLLGSPRDCVFRNVGDDPVRYAIVLVRR